MPKKTLEDARETNNNVLVQVKENQGYLFFDCKRNANGKKEDDLYIQKEKRKRNRRETRITKTFHHPDFIHKDKWQHLVPMIVQMTRRTECFSSKKKEWKTSIEISYYISTGIFSAKDIAKAIRNHWKIENRNHYVRDVSMGEDASRIRRNAGIFVKLRSFALNIMRHNGTQNIANELYKNSLSFDNLKKYKHLFN